MDVGEYGAAVGCAERPGHILTADMFDGVGMGKYLKTGRCSHRCVRALSNSSALRLRLCWIASFDRHVLVDLPFKVRGKLGNEIVVVEIVHHHA